MMFYIDDLYKKNFNVNKGGAQTRTPHPYFRGKENIHFDYNYVFNMDFALNAI